MAEPVATTAALLGIFQTIRGELRKLRQAALSDQHKRAVEDIGELVADAQDRLATIQTESIELREKNAELTRRLVDLDDWNQRFEHYSLSSTDGGAVVYQKSWDPHVFHVRGSAGGDPTHTDHYVCPSCVAKRELQILQDDRNADGTYTCPSCKTAYPIKAAEW